MNYSESYYSSSNIVVFLLLSLLTVSIALVGIGYEAVVSIARMLVYSVVGLLIVFYFSRSVIKTNVDKRLVFLLFLTIWVGVRANNYYGLGLFLQTFLLFMSALVLYNINFNKKINSALVLGGSVYIFLALIHFFSTPIFYNTNYIGVCGLIYCVFFLSKKTRFFYVLSFLCFLIVFFSGTRSALLGLIVAYLIYIIFKQKTYVKIASIGILSIVFFFFFKNGYYDYLNSDSFAQLVFDKTGKRLESGRFEIWNVIFSNMNIKDYIWGLGGGTDYEEIIGSKLSAHSGYVYIISSYGLVGLLFFLLSSIFSLINLFNKGYFFSFILFIALLFREFFEVTLLHNSFPIAVFFWAFLSNGYLDRNKTVFRDLT